MKKLFLLAFFMLGVLSLRAQSIGPSTLNAGGGMATLNGNTYEYSIGEMMLVHTASTGGLVVTQGLLQPNEIQNGIEVLNLNTHTSVYPNPTQDVLFIETQLMGLEGMDYSVWDIHGRLILHKEVLEMSDLIHVELSLNNWANGTYQILINAKANGQLYKGQYSIVKS